MAVVLDGVGKVEPDDALEGKSDRQIRGILKALRDKQRDRGRLTETQQKVFDNANKMLAARDKFRRENNYRGGNLATATLNELRSGSRKDVAKFIEKLKERQKASRPTGRGRRNPSPPSGEPF